MSDPKKMTAEERIQLDDRVRRLAWTDRIAYFGVAVLMEKHAAAAVAEVTRERDEARERSTALEHKLAETYASRSRLDCSFAGPYIEPDAGTKSHCPPEKPCQRCTLERERDEARAEVERLRALLREVVPSGGFHEADMRCKPGGCFCRLADLNARIEAALKAADGGEVL